MSQQLCTRCVKQLRASEDNYQWHCCSCGVVSPQWFDRETGAKKTHEQLRTIQSICDWHATSAMLGRLREVARATEELSYGHDERRNGHCARIYRDRACWCDWCECRSGLNALQPGDLGE